MFVLFTLSPFQHLDPFDEVIEEVEDECGDLEEENMLRITRGQKYRAHIKELIEERQDLKAQLHQTLKKLVLNRVPLPRIDGMSIRVF